MHPCDHDHCNEINHGICYVLEREQNEKYRRERDDLRACVPHASTLDELCELLGLIASLDAILEDDACAQIDADLN